VCYFISIKALNFSVEGLRLQTYYSKLIHPAFVNLAIYGTILPVLLNSGLLYLHVNIQSIYPVKSIRLCTIWISYSINPQLFHVHIDESSCISSSHLPVLLDILLHTSFNFHHHEEFLRCHPRWKLHDWEKVAECSSDDDASCQMNLPTCIDLLNS
jgi:hypothetical protein